MGKSRECLLLLGFPLSKGAPLNSPLKKGDKGGCFLCCRDPVIMSLQPEDVQKPDPHRQGRGGESRSARGASNDHRDKEKGARAEY
jgi:hypothetical protein